MILCTVIQRHYPVLIHCDNTLGFGLISNTAESQGMNSSVVSLPDSPLRQIENTVAHSQDSTSA